MGGMHQPTILANMEIMSKDERAHHIIMQRLQLSQRQQLIDILNADVRRRQQSQTSRLYADRTAHASRPPT